MHRLQTLDEFLVRNVVSTSVNVSLETLLLLLLGS
jgi:hypothetical protein